MRDRFLHEGFPCEQQVHEQVDSWSSVVQAPSSEKITHHQPLQIAAPAPTACSRMLRNLPAAQVSCTQALERVSRSCPCRNLGQPDRGHQPTGLEQKLFLLLRKTKSVCCKDCGQSITEEFEAASEQHRVIHLKCCHSLVQELNQACFVLLSSWISRLRRTIVIGDCG